MQWLAVALATAGVALLTIESGQVPWLALVIACTFSFYGLIRKTVAVEALPGLAAETLMLTPVGLAFLCWRQTQYGDVIQHSPWVTVLLLLSGLITAVPLVLFAYGVRRIGYATVGMLQYIGPTMQFILGLVVFKETLKPERLICFVLIWAALVIYAGDSVWRSRASRALA
jgi:chloramphenicol-sensitive protein RarD